MSRTHQGSWAYSLQDISTDERKTTRAVRKAQPISMAWSASECSGGFGTPSA